jgi:hypothetical protein
VISQIWFRPRYRSLANSDPCLNIVFCLILPHSLLVSGMLRDRDLAIVFIACFSSTGNPGSRFQRFWDLGTGNMQIFCSPDLRFEVFFKKHCTFITKNLRKVHRIVFETTDAVRC